MHSDQRTYLRSITRFFSLYGVFPRGYAKTYLEIAAMFIVCIRFPSIKLSLTAQTRENSASLLKDKTIELLQHFPLLENELASKPKFSKNDAEILFKNGSRIDNLSNSQNSKGQRRHRISEEESALVDKVTFEDALEPIVEVSRLTTGQLGIPNPEELNQQINFFTTAGFKGSDEYIRSLSMIQEMIDLKGKIVLGSSWMLPCWMGRGSTKTQILQKKKNMSPIAFAQNYEEKWVGASDGALVNINKLMACRNLTTPLLETEDPNDEYYIGVDVARSMNTNNNQSSVSVGKVNRHHKTNRIISIDIVNVINISNALNFTAQACEIKKLKNAYNAKAVIVDGNGLGAGLIDELLKESYDPITKEPLGCWDTMNTENTPEVFNADRCLFDMKAQTYQTKVISTFIDMIEGGKVRLLENKANSDFTIKDKDSYKEKVLPFVQTDFLFEEISNLKLKTLPSGNLTVEKIVNKINKDRWSALGYLLFYIVEFESKIYTDNGQSDIDLLQQYTFL